jgi:ubiquinone biosynthesis protein
MLISSLTTIRTKYRSFVRYNQILRVFVRYGFEEMVSYMISTGRYRFIRWLIPKTTKKNAQKYSRWEKMRLVCEELGPTFVKFGQILSNRSDLLPEELIHQLEKLQDDVPPMPGEIAKNVVESELRGSVHDIFAYFDENAFASASIAQVHRVTTHKNEELVLKIQRPGIRKIILQDIRVMYSLAAIFERRIPTLKVFDPHGLVKNFEESILKELDFIHESVNVLRFAKQIQDDKTDDTTHTIGVFKEYTTQRVLALEFIKGIKVTDTSLLAARGFSGKEIADRLTRSFIKQVFQYGFFHADPHPGNILIMPDGKICFLDFGMMGSIMKRDIQLMGKLFVSVHEKEVKEIIKSLQLMSNVSVIRDVHALETALFDFVHSYSLSTYHQHEMSTILLELKDVVVVHGLKVPSHFFLLARSMVTIEGVIHHLDPDLDVMKLARPYLVQAIRRDINPIALINKVLIGLFDLGNYMEEFPVDLKNAIRKINHGKVMVDLTHQGIDPMVHTINRVNRQLIMALIFAALTIGSVLFIIHDVRPHWNGVSFLGIVGLVLAVYLGFRMLSDVRKGDHDEWKGWDDNGN